MTTQDNTDNQNPRELSLGHLAAAVSHRTRAAIRAGLDEAGASRRDLRLLAVLEREPQTADALAERRTRRMEERKARFAGHDGHEHRGRRGHRMRRKWHAASEGLAGKAGARRRPTLEGKLADLEDRGLIAKGADGVLSLTEQGAALRIAGREALAALKERSTAGIPETDLETTRRTLRTLAHNLAG